MKDRDGSDEQSVRDLQEALGPDFEIKRRLGVGTMAAVYLAREPTLDRQVAIKVLHPGKAADEIARRRFEREARAAASLIHPNVVQVFRLGRLPDQTPYLVMQYVKGRTMEERLAAEGRLPAALAERVLIDVTEALAAAHAEGIVHRDLRPANVLWDEQTESALLSDFGIAALLTGRGLDTTRLTVTGQMVGDPRYLSPEQLQDEDLTELADMYSLGVFGYELLTGTGPYDARTNAQWINAHLTGEPVDLMSRRPDVSPRVADVLRRCLNRTPNHRPSAADASRILRGELAATTAGTDDGDGFMDAIRKRRFPQLLSAATATAAGFLAFMGLLVEMGTFGPIVWDLSLPFAVCGLLGAGVVAWFHGERGPQRAELLEWVLLGVVAVAWIAWSVLAVLAA